MSPDPNRTAVTGKEHCQDQEKWQGERNDYADNTDSPIHGDRFSPLNNDLHKRRVFPDVLSHLSQDLGKRIDAEVLPCRKTKLLTLCVVNGISQKAAVENPDTEGNKCYPPDDHGWPVVVQGVDHERAEQGDSQLHEFVEANKEGNLPERPFELRKQSEDAKR